MTWLGLFILVFFGAIIGLFAFDRLMPHPMPKQPVDWWDQGL